MGNSLLYGGLELLSGAGGTYNVVDGGRGLGDPQAVVQSVQAQLTQGSAVVGSFTDNRRITLTVMVTATSMPSLTAACEALAIEADRAVNTLTWTPGVGSLLPTVYETFRGQVTTTWSGKFEAAFARQMQLSFSALPFGRSDKRETISGTSSSVALADFSSPSDFSYVTVDASDDTKYPDLLTGDADDVDDVVMALTTHEPTSVTASPVPVEGTASSKISANFYKAHDALTYTTLHFGSSQSGGGGSTTVDVPAQGTAAATVSPTDDVDLDLSDTTNIVAALYSDTFTAQACYLTLTDSSDTTATFRMAPATQNTPADKWNKFSADVANSALDLDNITGWQLTVAVGPKDYTTGMTAADILVGELRAFPASSTLTTTTSGSTLLLAGVKGSARANATIRLDRGGTNTMRNFAVYRAPRGSTAPSLVHLSSSAGATTAPTVMSGTFRVWVGCNTADASPSSSGTLTITQKVNGTVVATKTLTGSGGSNSLLFPVGELTFPFVDTPAQVDDLLYGFSWSETSKSLDVILLDTRGFFVVIPLLSTFRKHVWIDEATATQGFGGVWGGADADRHDAASLLAETGISAAGAMTLDPGDNHLTAWCSDGAPNATIDYWPRWLHERAS